MAAAEHRHIMTQLKRLAKYYAHHNPPRGAKEIDAYNKRMMTLIRRKEYLEYIVKEWKGFEHE
jgi:hypothetical protein